MIAGSCCGCSSGLTIRDRGPVTSGLRYRHIGSRAADQAGSIVARGYTIVELFGTWQIARVQLVVTVDNLLSTVWNEAQFATSSRLRGSSRAANAVRAKTCTFGPVSCTASAGISSSTF